MWSILLLAVVAEARNFSDDEYAMFPRLYHLDDYEGCLLQTDGLYCLGTFQISPINEFDATFAMIEEYSRDPNHLDRRRVHRGYCVSSRCPALLAERNVTLRFERCVSRWARGRSLRTTLTQLGYCRTHGQHLAHTRTETQLDLPHGVFLLVLTLLLIMNIVGTAYDVLIEDDSKKSQLLVAWSVRSNWQRLTATYEDGDPRLSALAPVQGIRVILLALVMITHSGCIYTMLYLNNPRWVEQVSRYPLMMLFLNGTSVVQVFVMLSSFLLAYNVLLFFKSNVLSFKMLPIIIIKRIIRISPVYLLVVGYAATHWIYANSGPMWPATVEAESRICRAKFWTHVFYINNLINPDNICLVQTWFLAVDMQLYLVAAALTLALARLRSHALPLLGALVVGSSALNGVLAFFIDWQSLVYYAYPQTMSTMFRGIPSFAWYYQSPWGSLPACLVGLLMAFLHFELQEGSVKVASYKWLKLPYHFTPLLIIGWIMSGVYLRGYIQPLFMAIYVAIERPILSILVAFMIIGMVNGLQGCVHRAMSWRGWQTPGRLSLAALAVHWCVNMNIAAGRQLPLTASLYNVLSDWAATMCMSYAVAVPLAVMVEIPAQKFTNALLCRYF